MQGFLSLQDHEFWTNPTRTRDELLPELGLAGFEGMKLDGPAAVRPLRGRSARQNPVLSTGSSRVARSNPSFPPEEAIFPAEATSIPLDRLIAARLLPREPAGSSPARR